jgi:hypothetical protein
MNNQEILKLSECLWVDLKTHEQKRDFLLLGRGVKTGIIAPSMQNVLAHDYNIIVELEKDNAGLNQRIFEIEKTLDKLIDRAQQVDSWESFPESWVDEAYEALKESKT